MLIGEAVLRSPAFSPRLILLVQDLRAAGCTVWLEGLRLRFDLDIGAEPEDLKSLMDSYRDVVEWSREPSAELFAVTSHPRQRKLPHRERFGAKNESNSGHPTHK